MDISVITPLYNVEEEYLRASLDSLIAQTKIDGVEVIIVDDGSTNGCGDVADEYSEKYEFIRVIHVDNGGPGRARNIGIREAKGKYLAFLDSDDLMVEDMLAKMYARAELDQSEVVNINAERYESGKESRAIIHRRAFRNLENIVTVETAPDLIYDTVSWDKLIRRDFWNKHNLSYPEETIYEDIPVMTEALLKADRISIIRSIGYKWRIRELETRSLTQKRSQPDNLRARLRIMRQMDELLDAENAGHDLRIEKQLKSLKVDLKIYVNILPELPRERAELFVREMGEYIREGVSDGAMGMLNPVDRAIYEAVLEEDVDRLIKLVEFRTSVYENCRRIEKDSRIYSEVDTELFGEKMLDITVSQRYRTARSRIHAVEETKNGIRLKCQLYVEKINIPTPDMQDIKATLCDEYTGEEYELSTTPYNNRSLTKMKGMVKTADGEDEILYNYDGTGFYIDLNPSAIDRDITKGVIVLRYKNRFVEGNMLLRGMKETTKRALMDTEVEIRGAKCSLSVEELETLKIDIENKKGIKGALQRLLSK